VAGVGVLLAVLALGATGCGGGNVHVDAFPVSAADRTACTDVLAALPERMAGQDRRTVDGSRYAAAWGDPAIVLRCGVPLPRTFKGDPCITRNGIGWSVPLDQADDLTLDVVMTLAFRTPVLQVRLPSHYRPNGPSEVMADLDALVRAHTTSTGKHCE
jgi:hypothetical protein